MIKATMNFLAENLTPAQVTIGLAFLEATRDIYLTPLHLLLLDLHLFVICSPLTFIDSIVDIFNQLVFFNLIVLIKGLVKSDCSNFI